MGAADFAGDIFASATGVAGTGVVAEPSVAAAAVASVSGVETQGQVAPVAATISILSLADGVSAFGQVVEATARISIFARPTGVAATGSAGQLAAPIGVSIVVVTGVAATGRTGRAIVWGAVDANITPTDPWSPVDESGAGPAAVWGPSTPDPDPDLTNPWSTLAA